MNKIRAWLIKRLFGKESEPLIWTKNGNVPIASLQAPQMVWDVTPQYIKLREIYRDSNGDVVKESAHVYSNMSVAGEGAAHSLA